MYDALFWTSFFFFFFFFLESLVKPGLPENTELRGGLLTHDMIWFPGVLVPSH